VIIGATPEAVGRAAFEQSLELHELSAKAADLEELFLGLTAEESPTNESVHGKGGPA